MDDLVAFARLIDALRPWLDHLVIVGGWAHRLHRFTPLAGAPGYRPVTTRDADLAFGTRHSLTGDIATALKAAGFEQEVSGDDIPPVTAYRLGVDDQGFLRRLARLRHEQFGSVTDVHRAAVRIPQDRTIAPDLLQARCAFGLDEIFGD